MSNIPSSLKWLVSRRARIKGLIEASERELARFSKIQHRLPELKLDLEALDRTIRLHEIPIDPSAIPTVRVYADEKIRIKKWLSHGDLSRFLIRTLTTCESGRMTIRQLSQELLLRVAQKFPDTEMDQYDEQRVRELIRYRLKSLCNAGAVERVKPPEGAHNRTNEREWKLSDRNDAHHPKFTVDLRFK
jgi:hypothetical protein